MQGKYRFIRFMRWAFQFIGPGIAALIIWTPVYQDVEVSFFDKIGISVFIAGFFIVVGLGNYLNETIEQIKMDKRVVFSKNYAIVFLVFGGVFYLLRAIIDEAMAFFFICGILHLIAYGIEFYEKRLRAIVRGEST